MIEINFKFDKNEFVKGYTSNPQQKRSLLILIILGCIFTYSGISYTFLSGLEDYPYINFIYLGLGAILFFSYFRQKYNFGKFYDSNPSLQKDINYTFTNTTYKNSGDGYNAEIGWNTVYQVIENSEYFYIYVNKSIMYIIPKRAFTPEKLLNFKEILKAQKSLKLKLKE